MPRPSRSRTAPGLRSAGRTRRPPPSAGGRPPAGPGTAPGPLSRSAPQSTAARPGTPPRHPFVLRRRASIPTRGHPASGPAPPGGPPGPSTAPAGSPAGSPPSHPRSRVGPEPPTGPDLSTTRAVRPGKRHTTTGILGVDGPDRAGGEPAVGDDQVRGSAAAHRSSQCRPVISPWTKWTSRARRPEGRDHAGRTPRATSNRGRSPPPARIPPEPASAACEPARPSTAD